MDTLKTHIFCGCISDVMLDMGFEIMLTLCFGDPYYGFRAVIYGGPDLELTA